MASRARKTATQTKRPRKSTRRKTTSKRSTRKQTPARRAAKSPADNRRTGSSLESLLREEGLYEDSTAKAIKEVIAWQVEKEMQEQGITKVEMAKAMGTSRSALDRLLDPENKSVTLSTLFRAATVLGVELRVELVRAT